MIAAILTSLSNENLLLRIKRLDYLMDTSGETSEYLKLMELAGDARRELGRRKTVGDWA